MVDPVYQFPFDERSWMAPAFGIWYKTGGEQGEEPTELFKQVMDLYDEYRTTVDSAQQVEIGKEIVRLSTENLFLIQTVGMQPALVIAKNNMHNVIMDQELRRGLDHDGPRHSKSEPPITSATEEFIVTSSVPTCGRTFTAGSDRVARKADFSVPERSAIVSLHSPSPVGDDPLAHYGFDALPSSSSSCHLVTSLRVFRRWLRKHGGGGDARTYDILRERYGLDQPLHVQYVRWVQGWPEGDFGWSLEWNSPVLPLVASRLVYTMLLGLLSLLITVTYAIPVGIYSATHQYSVTDNSIVLFWFPWIVITWISLGIGLALFWGDRLAY